MSDRDLGLHDRIEKAPHWRVTIRPEVFEEERISSLRECWSLTEASRVSLRGWDYPHVDYQNRKSGTDWIESWTEFDRHRELWRFYQSGQFVHLFVFVEDETRKHAEERAKAEIRTMPPNFSPSGYLDVISTLWTITEIFEFAARLAQKGILDPAAFIEVQLVGIRNRVLFMSDPGRFWYRFYATSEDELKKRWTGETSQLISKSAELALNMTEWFFERFQWMDPPREVLANDQKRLLERRF